MVRVSTVDARLQRGKAGPAMMGATSVRAPMRRYSRHSWLVPNQMRQTRPQVSVSARIAPVVTFTERRGAVPTLARRALATMAISSSGSLPLADLPILGARKARCFPENARQVSNKMVETYSFGKVPTAKTSTGSLRLATTRSMSSMSATNFDTLTREIKKANLC